MDEFAGLDKGWNDPDMLMIGMNELNETMCRTHMAMWCMMNSPLMLGLDLRRVEKGDTLYQIIANQELIALNQDPLGIQAKRIFTTITSEEPDKDYITEHERCDILAKPLADGSVALCFINLSDHEWKETLSISVDQIIRFIGSKLPGAEAFKSASGYRVMNLWSGEQSEVQTDCFAVETLQACESITLRIRPI